MTSPHDRYRFDPLKTPQEDPDKDRPEGTRQILEAFQLPAEWSRDRRIENGYRLRPGEEGQTTHWFGGPAVHSGANCPLCKHPLRLVLDIDLKAGDIPAFLKSEF